MSKSRQACRCVAHFPFCSWHRTEGLAGRVRTLNTGATTVISDVSYTELALRLDGEKADHHETPKLVRPCCQTSRICRLAEGADGSPRRPAWIAINWSPRLIVAWDEACLRRQVSSSPYTRPASPAQYHRLRSVVGAAAEAVSGPSVRVLLPAETDQCCFPGSSR